MHEFSTSSALQVFFEYLGEYWYIVLLYIILSSVYVIETYLTKYLGKLIGKEDKSNAFLRIVQILCIAMTFRGLLYLLDSYFLPFFEKNVRLNLMERDIHEMDIDVGVSLKDAMTLPESMKILFEITRYTLFPSFVTSFSIIFLIYKIVPRIGMYAIGVFIFVIFICVVQVIGMNTFYSPFEIYSGDNISKNHADVIKNRASVQQYNQIKAELVYNEKLNVEYNKYYRGRFIFNYLFKIIILGISWFLLLIGTIIAFNLYKVNEINTSQISTITLLLAKYTEVNGRYIISIGEFSHLWKLMNVKYCFSERNFGFQGYRGHGYENNFAAAFSGIQIDNVLIRRGKFNLSIPKYTIEGPITCIHGLSGSGKTTLINTIMRVLPNYEGSIKVFDHELRDLTYRDINQMIAFLPQRPTLFNRTLLENIVYNGGSSREEVVDLIHEMGITNISEEDLDRKVNLEGDNFSGGQTQVACMLRAILRKKRLVIFDEPTSALDEENKWHVMHSIQRMSKYTTVLIVSHDKDMIRIAHQTLKLDKGKMIT